MELANYVTLREEETEPTVCGIQIVPSSHIDVTWPPERVLAYARQYLRADEVPQRIVRDGDAWKVYTDGRSIVIADGGRKVTCREGLPSECFCDAGGRPQLTPEATWDEACGAFVFHVPATRGGAQVGVRVVVPRYRAGYDAGMRSYYTETRDAQTGAPSRVPIPEQIAENRRMEQ